MQAEFGAAPQHVVGASCPFVVPQIAEFRFVQSGSDGFTEIGQGTGIAEQLLGAEQEAIDIAGLYIAHTRITTNVAWRS